MRADVWTVAGLAGALLLATSAEGRRVVSVSPMCPPEASEMVIDYEGAKDTCVARAPVTCQAGRTLAIDHKGNEDGCVTSNGVADKPSCPHGRRWKAKAGADECVATAAPVCPHEFHLQQRPGEDACTY
jgi:hypothetical protein